MFTDVCIMLQQRFSWQPKRATKGLRGGGQMGSAALRKFRLQRGIALSTIFWGLPGWCSSHPLEFL